MRAVSFIFCFFLLFEAALAGQNFRQRESYEGVEFVEDDIKAEMQFGREVAARIFGRYRLYADERLIRYVTLVGKAVTAHAGRPEIEFRFGILETGSVNAYAAPGGYVFITRGALEKVGDESELAAVLAHEIAHITGKHIVEELNIRASDDSPVSGVARLLGASGDPARVAFLKAADKAMEMLFERGYKIQDEKEADRNGTILLALSGYDPTALKRYLQRISGDKQTKILSKTHPPFEDRTKLIAEVIREEGLSETNYIKGKERFDAYVGK